MADNILGKLGEAVVLLRADGSKLSDDLKKERAALEKSIDKIGAGLSSKGATLTKAVTAPILAMGAAAISAGLKMDEALDTIRVKTGATGEALKGLEQDFKAVFASVPDDGKVVADTMSLLNVRLGATGEELRNVTSQMLTMSRITETDVKANVDAATQSFNAWQISTKDQGAALDYVFKVSQNTGASVTDLMTHVTSAQGVFKSLNMDFEESVALLGQMNKAGVDGGKGVAALQKAVATFAEKNIPAEEGLRTTLKLIEDLGPGSKATGLAMDVFGAKSGPQLAIAVHQGRLSVEDLMKTVKESKETIQGAAKDTDGFAESFLQLKNKATIALEPLGTKLIELGERALPHIEKMGMAVLGLVEGFANLPGPVQDVLLVLAGMAAAAGPVMMAVGALTNMANVAKLLRLTELPGLARSILLTNGAITRSTALLGLLGLAAVSMGTGIAIAKHDMDAYLETQRQSNELAQFQIKLNRNVGESWDEYIERVRSVNAAFTDTTGILPPVTGLFGKTAGAVAGVGAAAGDTDADLDAFNNRLGKTETAADKAADALKSLAASFGQDVIDNGLKYADALALVGGVTKLTVDETQQFESALDAAHQKMLLMGRTAGPEFQKIRDAWMQTQQVMFNQKVNNDLPTGGIDMKAWRREQDIGGMTRSLMSKVMKPGAALDFGPMIKLTPPPSVMKQFGKTIMDGLTGPGGFTSALGPTVLQALTGGGSVSGSIGALAGLKIGESLSKNFTSTLTKKLGSTMGGMVGSMLPGLGSLVAPLVSKGVAALGSAMSKVFGNNTKGAREGLAESMGFGNLGGLYADLRKMGAEGEKLAHIGSNLIGRNDEAGNRRWMEDVKRFYDDVAAKKQADLDAETAARDRLQSAIEKYGFTIEELGPKWRQQQLNEQALELVQDFTALKASGIDVDTIIRRMGDSIREFVSTALKTGSEIPESMRPMLERMVEMGELTDENGDKLTDLSKVKWSTTMTEGFKTVTDRLDILIQRITEGLGGALSNLPSPTVRVGVQYDYPDSIDVPAPQHGNPQYDAEGNPNNYPELKSGGVANWGRGTLAVLHGEEAVMPIDKLQEMVSSAGPSLNADDMVQAMMAAGLGRPNVNFAPVLEGALANEMDDFARKMWPRLIRVLQDDGTLNSSLAGTLGV